MGKNLPVFNMDRLETEIEDILDGIEIGSPVNSSKITEVNTSVSGMKSDLKSIEAGVENLKTAIGNIEFNDTDDSYDDNKVICESLKAKITELENEKIIDSASVSGYTPKAFESIPQEVVEDLATIKSKFIENISEEDTIDTINESIASSFEELSGIAAISDSRENVLVDFLNTINSEENEEVKKTDLYVMSNGIKNRSNVLKTNISKILECETVEAFAAAYADKNANNLVNDAGAFNCGYYAQGTATKVKNAIDGVYEAYYASVTTVDGKDDDIADILKNVNKSASTGFLNSGAEIAQVLKDNKESFETLKTINKTNNSIIAELDELIKTVISSKVTYAEEGLTYLIEKLNEIVIPSNDSIKEELVSDEVKTNIVSKIQEVITDITSKTESLEILNVKLLTLTLIASKDEGVFNNLKTNILELETSVISIKNNLEEVIEFASTTFDTNTVNDNYDSYTELVEGIKTRLMNLRTRCKYTVDTHNAFITAVETMKDNRTTLMEYLNGTVGIGSIRGTLRERGDVLFGASVSSIGGKIDSAKPSDARATLSKIKSAIAVYVNIVSEMLVNSDDLKALVCSNYEEFKASLEGTALIEDVNSDTAKDEEFERIYNEFSVPLRVSFTDLNPDAIVEWNKNAILDDLYVFDEDFVDLKGLIAKTYLDESEARTILEDCISSLYNIGNLEDTVMVEGLESLNTKLSDFGDDDMIGSVEKTGNEKLVSYNITLSTINSKYITDYMTKISTGSISSAIFSIIERSNNIVVISSESEISFDGDNRIVDILKAILAFNENVISYRKRMRYMLFMVGNFIQPQSEVLSEDGKYLDVIINPTQFNNGTNYAEINTMTMTINLAHVAGIASVGIVNSELDAKNRALTDIETKIKERIEDIKKSFVELAQKWGVISSKLSTKTTLTTFAPNKDYTENIQSFIDLFIDNYNSMQEDHNKYRIVSLYSEVNNYFGYFYDVMKSLMNSADGINEAINKNPNLHANWKLPDGFVDDFELKYGRLTREK